MVHRALSGSVAFVSVVLTTAGLSASCSSSSLGPPNGSSCSVNTDCASSCCVAGYDSDSGSATPKVCSEPAACQDASVPPGDDSGEDSSTPQDSSAGADSGTAADTSPGADSAMQGGDTGTPQDSGGGG
jgi:hypothetical protein